MSIHEQLLKAGFDPSFSPLVSEDWTEDRHPTVGKISYIYSETKHSKGVLKQFTYTSWDGEYHTFWELPSNFTKTDKKNLDAAQVEKDAERLRKLEAFHEIAKQQANNIWDNSVEPKLPPHYLEKKGLHHLKDYRVSLDNAETMIIPIYSAPDSIQSLQFIPPNSQKHFLPKGKTKGCYGIIKGSGKKAKVCEGISTAISIHLATGDTVFIVFSATNFVEAVGNIRRHYIHEFDEIVICADNDQHKADNIGVNKAKEAAKRFHLMLKIPTFKEYDGHNTTDFDDIRRLYGLDEVRKQLQVSNRELDEHDSKPAVVPLGYTKDGFYYFTSTENPNIQRFSTLDKNALYKLMHKDFWFENFRDLKKNTVDWDTVFSDLMRDCHAKRMYSPHNTRAVGVYIDEGRHVVHLGDQLYVDGVYKRLHTIRSKYTYGMREGIGLIHENQLTDAEALRFYDSFDLTTLYDKKSKLYVLGWMVCSIIAGSLDWRPHVYLTGPRGSGKTQITELMSKILGLGFKVCHTQGVQGTAVGVRQELESAAIPVIFDEVEGDSLTKAKKAEEYLSLCRAASSNSQAEGFTGSASQTANRFKVNFSAWVAGINPQLKEEADIVRFAVVETRVDKNKSAETRTTEWEEVSRYWDSIDEDWCKRFVSRIIKNLSIIKHNISVMTKELSKVTDARYADQYGTLLGASLIWRHINEISQEEVEELKTYAVTKRIEEGSDDMGNALEKRILMYILESPIITKSGDRTTVWEVLAKKDGAGEEEIHAISVFGVIPIVYKEERGIHIRNSMPIEKQLNEKQIKNGWKQLARIPGATGRVNTRFLQKVHRGTFIPEHLYFDQVDENTVPEELKIKKEQSF